MLTPHRVIDLTGERGAFAGFMLAQLGADVVLAEPAEGRERGSLFDAYNRGKRSIIVGTFEEVAVLAEGADVIISDQSIGFDVDLSALREANPALVTVSISPWGSTGPKADWLATDLTLVASSGQMISQGDGDRPPVRISVPQTWCHAGSQAAVGALIALEDRFHTGLGQHVDVSAQQAACETAVPAILHAPAGIRPIERVAGGAKFGNQVLRWVYPCADGWSVITFSFGQMIGPMVSRFVGWMFEEGFCDEATRDKDFIDLAMRIQAGTEPLSELDRIMGLFEEFALTKTKAEILERGLADSLLVAPVSTVADVVDSPQLAARDFWDKVDGERYPGPIVSLPAGRLPSMPAAPKPGEHSNDILSENRESHLLDGSGELNRRPLDGLKICDLSWVAAAPLTTKILAHWGATVVRVESVNRPCLLRQALGFRDDIVDQENAITWHSVNANKQVISLDLSKPEAREVVKDLAAWSDIVFDSFTPGTMARWGLGYDELRKIKDDLIVVSSCVMGQTGPYRDFAGFGNMSASVAGFFDVTGWPDRLPAGPYMAYTDYTSPRFTAMAILAAIDHRRATGEGQYLDFSQMEAATHLLTPALLDYQRTGEVLTRMGNADPVMCPHGVFATDGDDTWIAIACETDDQWRSLATEMRRPDLADLALSERRNREAEIEEVIEAWTSTQSAGGLQVRLQQHGVPAHEVQNSAECLTDPQLVHRNHFQWAPHAEAREAVVDAMPYTLSRSSGGYDWAGPTYGEHSMQVLTDILGYDADRIAELAIAEALE